MTVSETQKAREPFIPEGCIAAIPAQSVQSCERVIEALALELASVNYLLGDIIAAYVHDCYTTTEVRQDCSYVRGWEAAGQFLTALSKDWPHLNIHASEGKSD
jgi:hypothetical protein